MTAEAIQDMKLLAALRDEVKLKIHLGKMELRTEWEKLEPQIERALSSAAIVSKEAVADLEARLKELQTRIGA